MKARAFGLNKEIESNKSAAKIFGESFQLEDGLLKQLGTEWHLKAYTDAYETEHIHIFRTSDTGLDNIDEDASQWEVLEYSGEEAPLELLLTEEDI